MLWIGGGALVLLGMIRAINAHRELKEIERLWLENQCDCSAHDITTPGAAHAEDCPQYD